MTAVILESTLTCPQCGAQVTETMPTDMCVVRWRCPACGAEARPAPGDCCVYCTYGSVACPPIQQAAAGGGCCSSGA
jgi:hypothetical protein